MSDEPDRPLTKRELRTLKNALGKQGISMEQHEAAQKLAEPAKILQIDCFALREHNGENPVENHPDAEGWYVGYGVAMNGVGRTAGAPEDVESSDDSDEEGEGDSSEEEDDGESSGFESDPPTDEEEEVEDARQERRESDDVSDKGQLLYGVDHQFYVHKTLRPKNCVVHYIQKPANIENVNANQNENEVEVVIEIENQNQIENEIAIVNEFEHENPRQPTEITESFTTGRFVTTMRYPIGSSTENTANTDDELHPGYQMIGDGSIPCVTSHSEDESEEGDDPDLEDVTTSAGLWCNFVLTPEGFEGVKKEQIPEEKLKTIPLDAEKLAQISAAMAGLQLPTPPGWEGVSDEKLLEFINRRV